MSLHNDPDAARDVPKREIIINPTPYKGFAGVLFNKESCFVGFVMRVWSLVDNDELLRELDAGIRLVITQVTRDVARSPIAYRHYLFQLRITK